MTLNTMTTEKELPTDCKSLTGRDPWTLIGKTDGYIRKLIRSKVIGDAVPAYIEELAIEPPTKEALVATLCEWVRDEVWEQMPDEREMDAHFSSASPDLFDTFPEEMRLRQELV